jgi:hypothetical protein
MSLVNSPIVLFLSFGTSIAMLRRIVSFSCDAG